MTHSDGFAVVGAGITGLTTAARLADAGHRVVVLEAAEEVGGQLHTRAFADRHIDLGAEALHTAGPGVRGLVERAGLTGDLVPARPGTTLVATHRGLRRLPSGMGPAGPTRLWPVVSSRVLGSRGLLRAALEPLVPPTPPGEDTSVGDYLTNRFGRQLVDRLVAPLLGNLHAADVDRLSLAAAAPQLDALARRHRSLVLARRRGPRPTPPAFASLRGGLQRLAQALGTDPRIEVRTGWPVTGLTTVGDGYRLTGPGGTITADGVVLAVPAAAAAELVASLESDAARMIGELRTASIATVLASFPRAALTDLPAFAANGLLVPPSAGRALNAATVLTNKWPHLAADDEVLVRLSLGGDAAPDVATAADTELAERAHADLRALTGLRAPLVETLVHRWPATMPQLEVGHHARLAEIRGRLEARHRIVLAGAPYDGVGISNAVASADAAAHRLLTHRAPREQRA